MKNQQISKKVNSAAGLAKKATDILEKLEQIYPDAMTGLAYRTPYQLLVATILSAQCTDKKVNAVTEELFKVADTPKRMVAIGQERLMDYIKTAGLYQNKSRNIIKASEVILEKHGGQVPANREELEKLPGVGRKTASVVLANAFDHPEFPVDTHVFRVTRRIGLTKGETPYSVEQDLKTIICREKWYKAHLLFILHGRNRCKARTPDCKACKINDRCDDFLQNKIDHNPE